MRSFQGIVQKTPPLTLRTPLRSFIPFATHNSIKKSSIGTYKFLDVVNGSVHPLFRFQPSAQRFSSTGNSDPSNDQDAEIVRASRLETERQVNELIETYARPHAQSDGGDIAFLRMDHDTGVVHVTMKGACVSCSSSTITLKFMVLKLLQNYLDGITDVEGHDEEESEESEESDELW